MKAAFILAYLMVVIALGCTSVDKTATPKIKFDIYETVKVKDISMPAKEAIRHLDIRLEKDANLPIAGYVLLKDTTLLQVAIRDNTLKLLPTVYTLDLERKYHAAVVVKHQAVITNDDVKRAKEKGVQVEIRFTMAGAKKWADMIQDNMGQMVAFTIDDVIYSMPLVNARIDNGSALLSGLPDEETAKKIADSLNAGRS